MAEMASVNLELAVNAACEINLKSKEDFYKREKYIDWLNQEIPNFLTKISALHISYEDEIVIASYYHVVSDIERIGDYAENIINYTQRMSDDGLTFSEQAQEEIRTMFKAVVDLYFITRKGFEDVDISLKPDVERIEDSIDDFKSDLSNMHIKRLNDGICSAQTGALYLSLVSNLERIADHMRNVYFSILKYARPVRTLSSPKPVKKAE
jgi:phosphate:Na+ symporter